MQTQDYIDADDRLGSLRADTHVIFGRQTRDCIDAYASWYLCSRACTSIHPRLSALDKVTASLRVVSAGS